MQKTTKKLLVSACLLGQPVRYDGKSKPINTLSWLKELEQNEQLVIACPEMLGGLSVPRPPAERMGKLIATQQGVDVTSSFLDGAKRTLELCLKHQVKFALLKANSPSCGNQQIYDGSFSGQLIEGKGVTAELLEKNGIIVFSEQQLGLLRKALGL
jgi:uncharacterized protein YbbK (DUF523 family)